MKKVIITIIVIAIVLAGGYFLLKGDVASQSINQPSKTAPESFPSPTTQANEVIYTDAGFSPSTLTVRAGDTVTFKNQSSSQMWVGSAMHPSHIIYSDTMLQEHCPDTTNTAFDQCQGGGPGTSWSFTFQKTGTWGYHNHLNARYFGKITVE